jgi:hypothetical protein
MKKIKEKKIKWFWEWEAHKYGSYHFRRKRNNFHYTIFYSLLDFVLFIFAFGLDYPYSLYVLILAMGVSVWVLYWVWREILREKFKKKKRKKHKVRK